ncbi:MAG: hypothetical protein ABL909_02170 [Sphingopyxis sp.]
MSSNLVFMIVAIVAIVTFGRIYRDKHGLSRRHRAGHVGHQLGAAMPYDDSEARALREEVRALKERIAVLERITTDNHSAVRLDQEIESLRDQREATTSGLRDR